MDEAQTTPRQRQEIALCALFDEAPHALEGRTYVQKLAFLFQKHADDRWFMFEAYDFGPFSRELYGVLEYCLEYDYVTETEVEDDQGLVRYHYAAGPAIGDVFGHGGHEELRETARSVFDDYPSDDLGELLRAVYSEYPKMARNSVY